MNTLTNDEQPFILIADDDLLIQEVLSTKLERAGFEVIVAGDGEEALRMISERQPDILLLDIKMPGPDGYEICRRLRAAEATRALPILMITAYGGTDYIVKGIEIGADDYITKPFDMEEVLVRVRSLLRMRRIERQLREKESHLARIEVVGQLLVTMAHYINNSLAVISGRAQALKDDNPEQARKLREACFKQTRKISAVLESLEAMAKHMKISTTSYAGMENAMLDIEKEIQERLGEEEDNGE
ncbi:MAG: response regulator [bacterium]|nr:response regulator [bacterium]